MKLSLEKCQFYRTSVTYLGHVVSAGGVATDPKKLEAVTSWPQPKTVTELRFFLGFCSYYRRFVENFATIARPLNELLHKVTEEDDGSGLKTKKSGARRKGESVQDQWTHLCEEAFKRLKKNGSSCAGLC